MFSKTSIAVQALLKQQAEDPVHVLLTISENNQLAADALKMTLEELAEAQQTLRALVEYMKSNPTQP